MRYFSARLIWSTALDSAQQYIFMGSPHGVVPFGHLITVLIGHAYMNIPFHGVAARYTQGGVELVSKSGASLVSPDAFFYLTSI
jgi:hypothetical protein